MNTTGKYVPRNSNQTNAFSNNNRMNGTSAFGNKDNEYRQSRRREAEAEAYRAEAERQRLKVEAAAVKKKMEDSMNYTSEEFYPSLGASSVKKAPSNPVSYKQKMVEAEEQRKLLITTASDGDEEEDENLLITIKMRNQQIMNKIFNRPSVVHPDYYDEEQYERDDIINIDYTETDDHGSVDSEENLEEEQSDELNGHVIAERRSGDKSLW